MTYSTATEEQNQRSLAANLNELAKIFVNLGIETVKFVSYDSNVEN